MAGVNTFIDHDLSRSHTRIGVGAEYWRDYLKLSANGYIRASGWKKSPDVQNFCNFFAFREEHTVIIGDCAEHNDQNRIDDHGDDDGKAAADDNTGNEL